MKRNLEVPCRWLQEVVVRGRHAKITDKKVACNAPKRSASTIAITTRHHFIKTPACRR